MKYPYLRILFVELNRRHRGRSDDEAHQIGFMDSN
jgi:hypothetical protein